LPGPNPVNVDVGSLFVDPGPTASDACEGDLTASILRTGTVNTAVPGHYELFYAVTDSSGNTSTTNRTVLVRGWPTVSGTQVLISGTNAVTGGPAVQVLGDVSPNGLPSAAFIQYGLSTAYPGRTVPVILPASYTISTFLATLDGLIPGLTYHFRLAATNDLGAAYGPDQVLTVPAPAPGDRNGDGQVDPAELNAVLSNYWFTSDGLWMTNAAQVGAGAFQFTLPDVDGWNLSVLASTNLTNWDLLGTAHPVYQFVDPAATNSPDRFYRLRWP